jgi:hypothetical protein
MSRITTFRKSLRWLEEDLRETVLRYFHPVTRIVNDTARYIKDAGSVNHPIHARKNPEAWEP